MSRCHSLLALALLAALSLSLLPFSSAVPCGGAGYDLSPLTYNDYSFAYTAPNANLTSYVYYLHLCGNVTYAGCQGLEAQYGGSMLCQVPTGYAPYSLAKWQPDATSVTWQPLGGQLGVTMSLQDGQGCGSDTGSPRSLTINFICDNTVTLGTANFVNLTEQSTCNYVATVRTANVCPAAATNANCGYGTMSLTSISGSDLVYQNAVTNYTYYYRPCGVVTSPQCANSPYGAVAGTAMVCQATGLNGEITGNIYDLSWWNPTLAQWRYQTINGGTTGVYIMDIQDGVTCGGLGSRAVQIRFECLASATTPILYNVTEVFTCFYRLNIQTSLACGGPPPVTQANGCGGAYDLSLVSQNDMIWQDPNAPFIYAFRPCGVVQYQQCQSNGNSNTSMMCQAETSNPTAHNLATYVASATSYQPTVNGLQMYIQDGDLCGTTPRSLTVNFQCNQPTPANSPVLVNVVEAQTCQYVATVNTSTVCRTGRPSICGPNGASGTYDFSLYASSPDYSWVSPDSQYTYYFRPCGAVVAPACTGDASTAGSMMCQSVNGVSGGYDIAVYDQNLVAWNKLVNGWQMYVQDGTSCGTYDRALTVNFICQTGVAYLANLTEVSTCNYVATVYTPQACTAFTPANGASTGVAAGSTGGQPLNYENPAGCGGPYDLSSLANQDLVYSADPNYNWYLRPCGSVQNANCSGAAASSAYGAMLCQAAKAGGGASTAASSYNAYQTSYSPRRQGVLMSLTDGGYCAVVGQARTTNVLFTCNAAATTAYISNVTEAPTCTYNVVVQTSLTCPQPATTCTGAGYDLSRTTTAGDLQLVNATSGYTFYFDPCGTVQNSVCQANADTSAAMMCQVQTGTNTSYQIATYIPSALSWSALPNGAGVQWVVQDGSTCNGYDFERKLTVNFLCGGNGGGAAQFLSLYEATVCNYVAYVQLNGACNTWQTAGGSSSSSSSLSGGAIAGIVIGSVVGAALLLAILVCLCCGAGAGLLSRSSKKGGSEVDGDNVRGSGKYGNDLNEQSHTGVELSDVHTNDGENETA